MNNLRKTIFTAVAATFLAVSLQPASAGGGFGPGGFKPGMGKPGIVKPWGPGKFKPGKIKPHKPHKPHHGHGNGAAAAALGIVGGLIIGNAIAGSQNQARPVSNSNAHIAWCDGRYKTYDWQSDTYMSNSGYRKYCNSPYN